jgi:hypothetical protein
MRRHDFDFVFSHTVFQHVKAPTDAWKDIGEILCRDGVSTHQISFDSHGVSAAWNGHWTYPEPLWRLALGRKEFLINREPLSSHVAQANAHGLQVVNTMRFSDASGIERSALARRWRHLRDDDLTTRGAFLIAYKA